VAPERRLGDHGVLEERGERGRVAGDDAPGERGGRLATRRRRRDHPVPERRPQAAGEREAGLVRERSSDVLERLGGEAGVRHGCASRSLASRSSAAGISSSSSVTTAPPRSSATRGIP